MKVSRTIAYAIHATLQLARGEKGVPIPCSQLAGDGQMPERFLLQILRSLVTRGILCSTRGVDGGYCLARPAEEISLRDIVESFENSTNDAVPELEGLPTETQTRITTALSHASQAAHKELERWTMADLLRGG
jgi:Rrf2 family protein